MTHDELVKKLDAMFRAKDYAKGSRTLPYVEQKQAWQDFKLKEKEIRTYVNINTVNNDIE